jgi:FAD/FMN-containing dehydrogenase
MIFRDLSEDRRAPARDLRACVRGSVYEPGDTGYDEQRATWSGAFPSSPALVVDALTPADVANAVLIARRHDLPLGVQSTGHGTVVPCDGGVLIKTSSMAEVLVDAERRTVRVGGGAVWQDVIEAAAPFGLAPVMGSHASVGVAGYTLGGGVGLLSRRFGYGADNLLRAEVVTADGRVVHASADRNPDLFWALRGAGANFGVVTSMEIRLHPVAYLFGGRALFPIGRAEHAIARFRDLAAVLPRELALSMVLLRESPDPDVPGPVLEVRGAYFGDADDGVRALLPIWRAGGTPLRDGFRSMPYARQGEIGATPPLAFELFADLPDALIGRAIDEVTRPVGAEAIDIRLWGGAMADVGLDAGPVGHRDVPFSMTINGGAESADALRPYATGGSFLNSTGDQTRTRTAYTAADYAKLRGLKRVYDPDNVFGRNHNIPPAESGPARGRADVGWPRRAAAGHDRLNSPAMNSGARGS